MSDKVEEVNEAWQCTLVVVSVSDKIEEVKRQNNASHCFICSGAKVDAKNNDGKTASEVAELNERPEIVVLIEKHEKAAKKT